MPLSPKHLIPALMILLVAMGSSDLLAQGRGRRGPQRGGRGAAVESPQRLLRSEAIQKELEMTEEQIESLTNLSQGQLRGQGIDREALRAELEGLSNEEKMAKIKEMRASRSQQQLDKIGEILLPHQMERLSQLSVQASARSGVRSLVGGALAEKLGITDEQKEQLQEKSRELQQQFAEKVAELRAGMQAELLESLTPEQQSQFKEISGEPFTFEAPQRSAGPDGGMRNRGRRGGGPNRGGRGGNRQADPENEPGL